MTRLKWSPHVELCPPTFFLVLFPIKETFDNLPRKHPLSLDANLMHMMIITSSSSSSHEFNRVEGDQHPNRLGAKINWARREWWPWPAVPRVLHLDVALENPSIGWAQDFFESIGQQIIFRREDVLFKKGGVGPVGRPTRSFFVHRHGSTIPIEIFKSQTLE